MSPNLLYALNYIREDMRANPRAFVSRTPLQYLLAYRRLNWVVLVKFPKV